MNFERIKEHLENIKGLCISNGIEIYTSNNHFDIELYKRMLLITLLEAISQGYYKTDKKNQIHFAKLIIEKSGHKHFSTISVPTLYKYSQQRKTAYQKIINNLSQNEKNRIQEKINEFCSNSFNWELKYDLVGIVLPDYKCSYAWSLYDYRSQLIHAFRGGCGLDIDKMDYVCSRQPENVYLTISSKELSRLIVNILDNIENVEI